MGDEGSSGNGWNLFSGLAGYDDPGTDYSEQTKETWIRDTDALDMINEILGLVNDTAYKEFVNEGAYKALVEQVGDSKESQSGSSTTQSETEELMEITITVTRADNDSPMIVKIWCVEDDGPGGSSMLIRGYFEVQKGVSKNYPYGVMEAHFKAVALDESGEEVSGDPLFTMAMSISADDGDVTVQFVEQGSEEVETFTYEWDRRARIATDDELSSGNAYIYCAETDGGTQQLVEETFFFAFNEDYLKYQKESSFDVAVLDKNDYDHLIFRYKLFESESGDAVERDSGFPIRLESGEYGYIGYYGVWLSCGAEVDNGVTITRVDTGEDYELVYIDGKLIKHTRQQTLLGDIAEVEIAVRDENGDFVVIWDGVSTFLKTGQRDLESGEIVYLETPEPYTFENEWDGGWCESLSAFLPLGSLTPVNGDVVYYHSEEMVSPADAEDLLLYYWGFALDVPITQDVIDNAATAREAYEANAPEEKAYFYDSTNLVLKVDDVLGDEVILADTIDLDETEYQESGYHIMPLTENSTYTPETCWEIYENAEFHSWTTGPYEWNKLAAVKNGTGVYAQFEAPLRLSYTHSTDNDINGDSTRNGQQFNLDYDGSELHMPWCFDENLEEWMPVLNLKDGTTVTAADSPSTEYVVKATEEELIMVEVTDAGILTQLETDLPIDNSIDPPTLTYSATKTAKVGAVPDNAALKVIRGEVIE